MLKYVITYLATGIVFWVLDLTWLAFVVKDFSQRELGSLLLASPEKIPALLFYLLYVVGMVVFAVLPALSSDSCVKAVALGAMLGLIAYATYDLSNLATLKGWSVPFALLDISWGTVVTAVSSAAGFFIARALLARI